MLKGSRKEGKREDGELDLSEVVPFAVAGMKIIPSSVKKAGGGGESGEEEKKVVMGGCGFNDRCGWERNEEGRGGREGRGDKAREVGVGGLLS